MVIAFAERACPRRPKPANRVPGWITNISIAVIDVVVLRALFPLAAVGVAWWAEQREWGVLHALDLGWFAGVGGFLLLDFAIYLQHVASHKFAILWRVHRVHHVDPHVDITTAVRFHPIEILLSMAYKTGLIIIFGIPVNAVFIFEVMLSSGSLFTHANIALPATLDRWLRYVIVTPDMHRIHHSVDRHETDSNFGFNLSLWDRLARTYVESPRHGHMRMSIGLPGHDENISTRLWWNLRWPFMADRRRRDGDADT